MFNLPKEIVIWDTEYTAWPGSEERAWTGANELRELVQIGDGNIGAAKGNPKMHIHIFSRLKTGPNWGGPLQLPRGEGPYGNEPLQKDEIAHLRRALVGRL